MKKKNSALVIAGASGSGKTGIAEKLAKELKGAIMYFDRYSHLLEFTTLNGRKLEEKDGPNPNNFMITDMVNDLKRLKEGKIITEPLSRRKIKPKKYIIIEDPHGRERLDIRPLYDFVILIDTPLEICLARVLLRTFAGKYFMREGTGELISQEEANPKEKISVLEKFILGQY